ncbi:hemagglutinin repeat-containing protein, partial [Vibrio genomosp. F10]
KTVKAHRSFENESVIFRRSLLSLSISALLFSNIAYAAAPTPNADSGAVVYDKNGIPIVDVAAPTSTGFSYNSFINYDVDDQGLVINNSLNSGTSQLVGELGKNHNFTNQAADVVLAEVVGDEASNLQGMQEMFGESADFILANPNGINVNGASFLNTNETTLNVGNALIDEAGELEGLTTSTSGINAALNVKRSLSSEGAITLLSPQIVTAKNANIQAGGELNLYTGRFHYRPSGIDIVEQLEGDEQRSIDAQLLGAMKAGRINIISTREGAGINLNLDTSTQRGLMITSAGDLELSGTHIVTESTIDAEETTTEHYSAELKALGKLYINNATINASDGVSVAASKSASINNTSLTSKAQGYIQVKGDEGVSLTNVAALGGSIARIESTNGNLSAKNIDIESERQILMVAKNAVSVRNGKFKTSPIEPSLNSSDVGIELNSQEESVSVSNITGNSAVTQLKADDNIDISSADVEGDLAVYSQNGDISATGNIDVSNDANINADKGTTNFSGNIDVVGSLVAAAAKSSRISGSLSGENITVTSDENLSVSGSVFGEKNATLVADGSTNISGSVSATDVTLRGDKGLDLNGSSSHITASNDMFLVSNAGNVTVKGSGDSVKTIRADNNLVIDANNFTATLASVEAGNDLQVDVDGTVNVNAKSKTSNGRNSNTARSKIGRDCWEISVFGLFNLNTGLACSDRIKTVRTNETWTDTTYISSHLSAGNDLTIYNADTINVTGSTITAGNNASLITDKGNINIKNAVNSHTRRKSVDQTIVSNYRNERRSEHTNYSNTSTHSSVVKAEADLTLKSANDINIIGSAVIAGGTVLIDAARDVAIKAAQNTETTNSTFNESNVKTSAPGLLALLGVQLDLSNANGGSDITSTTHTGSVIEGANVHINAGINQNTTEDGLITANNVSTDKNTCLTDCSTPSNNMLSSNGNVLVEGSFIEATDGDIIVKAENNIFNNAVYNESFADVWKEDHQLSTGFNWLSDFSIETADRRGDLQAHQKIAQTNNYLSSGDIIFEAGDKFNDQASIIEGKGTVSVEADSITQEAVKNSSSISANLSEFTTSSTLSVDVNGLKETKNSWGAFAQSLIDLAKGPKESPRALNVNDHLNYALGKEIKRETVVDSLGFNDISIPTIPAPNTVDKLIKEPNISIGINVESGSKESEYQRIYDAEKGGSITGGKVILTAREGDINLEGSNIESTDGETVLNAKKGDLNITALEENLSVYAKQSSQNSSASFNIGITPKATPVGITLGTNISTSASNYYGNKTQHIEHAGEIDSKTDTFLLAENGSITLIATDIKAEDDIKIIAGEGIDVQATTNTLSTSQSQSDTDFSFGIDLASAAPFLTGLKLGSNVSNETLKTNGETHEESTFAAGGDITIKTKNGNLELTAPVIGSNGDIEITADNGQVKIKDSIDKGSVYAAKHGNGFNFSWASPITIGAGFHAEADTHDIQIETSDTGVLIANNNVYVKGGNGLVLVGADIAAGDTVELDGGKGSIDYQASITNNSENLSVNEFSFGFGNLKLNQDNNSVKGSGLTLPSINTDIDFQRLNISSHIEKGGSVAGDNVVIKSGGVLNLHGTTITANNEPEIDVALITAKAAISTEKGSGDGFQLNLGIPSYNTQNLESVTKGKKGTEWPDLPYVNTGFQYYSVDKQRVTNATINGTAINPSSEQNIDHEFGVGFKFGANFSNANKLKNQIDKIDEKYEGFSNITIGAAAIATALTEASLKFNAGSNRPGFGFSLNPKFELEPGARIEEEISSFFSDVPNFAYSDFK